MKPLSWFCSSLAIVGLAASPAAALQCVPDTSGLSRHLEFDEWSEVVAQLDSAIDRADVETLRLRVINNGVYGRGPRQLHHELETPLPEDWLDLVLQLEQLRETPDRPVDAVMEVYDASENTEDAELLLVISGGRGWSELATDGRTNAVLYRAIVNGDRAALVRCY